MGCSSSRRRWDDECCPGVCQPVYEIPCPPRRKCCSRDRCPSPCEPQCYPQNDCCPPRRRCCIKKRCRSPCTTLCPVSSPIIPLHLIHTPILNSPEDMIPIQQFDNCGVGHQQGMSPIYEQNFFPDQLSMHQANCCC